MSRAVDCIDLFKVHRTSEGDAAALQGLTLSIETGEIVACLGPSGSGKSTLITLLAGLETASAGVAAVLGHDLGRLPARRRAVLRRTLIGIIDQHAEQALAPDLTIRDAIALGPRLRGASTPAARGRADALLERVGLEHRSGARPAELSGGERQRAAVCAAIAHRPRLLLADEPTGELDAVSSTAVLALFSELAREEGATVLLVTHDPAAARSADRTIALRDGRLSDERRDGVHAAVVARGGWLRVPETVLGQAGITDRARVELTAEGVLLQPIVPRPAAMPSTATLVRGPAPTGTPVFAELHDVGRGRGPRTTLAPISATFSPGSFTAAVGRSGSGKTTLLRLLAGLEPPDHGHVSVAGKRLDALDRSARAQLRSQHVAMVGQGLVLAPHLTGLEQVGLNGRIWLEHLGLADRAGQPIGRLSGGERQRVALARALASTRGLILLDEPSSRLDQANAAHVASLLATVARDHGRTIVCATHDPVIAAQAGILIELGNPEGHP